MNPITDAVTLAIIRHRLETAVRGMEFVILEKARSALAREARDFSTALFDIHGRILAEANVAPLLIGTLMSAVPEILKDFPVATMQDGDVFLANDPYRGGTHLPDVTVVVPILYQGEVLALGCSILHHQDIGAMTPGTPTNAISTYQEGLNLPPIKLYEAGKVNAAVEAIIRNNVRTADIVMGDLEAQVAAGNMAKTTLVELFEEYGRDATLAAMNQLLDHAETLTRQGLLNVRDGTYSFVDYMDNDGVDLDRRIRIHSTVTIKGSEFIVDFSDSNAQVKGPVNCPVSATLSACCFVLKALSGVSEPTNEGCYRPLTVSLLPVGSLLNPRSPAPVGARSRTVTRVNDALMGALVQAAPDRLPACSGGIGPMLYFGGTDPHTGRAYVTGEAATGAMGARPTKDGVDVITPNVNLGWNVPVEVIEMNAPLRVVKHALREDSGGAGEYRGGLGLAKIIKVLRGKDVSVTFRGERHFIRPWGLFGGLPGSSAQAYVMRVNGKKEVIPSKWDSTLEEGDEVHFFSAGGGGYGDPLKRKPDLVLQDVVDGRVSIDSAATDYGVVIDRDSASVDSEKTKTLREEMSKTRGPITWTYDRGPDGGRE